MNLNLTRIIKSILFVSTILLFSSAYGQSEQKSEPKNSIFVEALGHGFLYSLNYERVIFGNSKLTTSGQIGVSYYGKQVDIIPLWVPISVNQSLKIRGNNYLEAGIGRMFRNDIEEREDGTFDDNYQFQTWIFRLGYKYYSKNNNWLFKIAYTPIFQDKSDFVNWAGLGFGYRF